MVTRSSISRREQEITFHPALVVVVSLLAVFMQVYLPHPFPWFALLDVPLIVVIFFAISRRNPIEGTLTGMVIGLVQDAMTAQPIGINGMAKAIIGYVAASLGVRVDVENGITRLLLSVGFTFVHSVLIHTIERRLMGVATDWLWLHEMLRAVVNGVAAVGIFFVLDRTKRHVN